MFLGCACVGCGQPGDRLCGSCLAALQPAVAGPAAAQVCGVGSCVALLAYEGVGREVVVALKYRNARSLLAQAGRALAIAAGGPQAQFDVVTWAPTAAPRRRRRGYDQAELLASSVARAAGVPCRALLRRAPGPAQTGRSRAERLQGPRFTARAAAASLAEGTSVLVVDDVLTTGATLAAAAAALHAVAPVSVHAAVLAHAERVAAT